MSDIERAAIDRCSTVDRRVVYDLDYFQKGGIERRKGKNRRSHQERRNDWIRISKWTSMNIRDLKIEEFLE